ncbi:MAG: sigma-70 family RNA polymerase sigma factor [Nocardioidaceae bacterium]
MVTEDRALRFEAVVRAVIDPLRRFLARRTDAATAEDVLADTLLVIWRRLDDVPAEPLPWSFAVARNVLANAERSERRRQRLAAKLESQPAAAADWPSDGGDLALPAALASLRPQDAELLRLWAWEQLSPAEMAVALHTTPNAVSIRLHRAKAALREALRKTDDPAGHEGSEGRTR